MLLQSIIAIWSFKTLLSNAASGKATYYGGNENGNACGYIDVPKNSFPYGYYAAAGSTVFDSGYGCGKCFTITCIGPYDSSNTGCSCDPDTPTVTVQVMDQCPECSASHFDLNPDAMELIVADGKAGTCGVIEIEYEEVTCDYTDNIRIRNKGGTSQWWYGLHLDYVGQNGGISEVEIYDGNNRVGYCTKDNGPSFWICTALSGTFPVDNLPIDIKLTDYKGKELTCEGGLENYNGGASMDCGTNYGSTGGSSPVDAPTPPPVDSPTDKPTSKPTDKPTNKPTDKPTSGSSGGGGTERFTITNKNGLNQWWYAVVVTDSNGDWIDDDKLQYVKMKDANHNSYEAGTSEWDYWKFNGNPPYAPPFYFKVKYQGSSEETITPSGISSLAVGDATTISLSTAYTEDDNDDNKLSWGAWFAIIFCILLIIACIVFGTFCYIKRQKQKGQVEFDEKYQVGDTPTGTAAGNNDNKQTNETQEEPEEIEVEMDIETR